MTGKMAKHIVGVTVADVKGIVINRIFSGYR